MPRRPVRHEYVHDSTKRGQLYRKRKPGALKKMAELDLMTGCDIGVIMLYEDTVTVYGDIDIMYRRYQTYAGDYDFYNAMCIRTLEPGNITNSGFILSKENTSSNIFGFADSSLLQFD